MILLPVITLSSLLCVAFGHAVVTRPPPRAVGPATRAACGAGVYAVLSSDNTAPIEYTTPRIDSGYNATACPISFCRGLNFEDNRNNVQRFTAGQTIPFQVSIRVRHNGFANVSVVDTQTRTTIGAPLFTWPLYTDTTLQPSQYPKNETDFSVTLPDLGTRCTATGACAIQWWWIGSNQQTYMSCVDFVTV